MIRQQVAIVDYGLGNQASVQNLVLNTGHRCCITDNADRISDADLVILPGVGAFSAAMQMLHRKQLKEVLVNRAKRDLPILGICLGMQLLADSSEELGFTSGLGLIPGKVTSIQGLRWHIGWNHLHVKDEPLLLPLDDKTFFFNHAYAYEGPDAFIVAMSDVGKPMPAVIRKGRVMGVQFHPEKSQEAGRLFLAHVIDGLCV